MSDSSSRLRLSKDVREALREAVLLKLPPGSPPRWMPLSGPPPTCSANWVRN